MNLDELMKPSEIKCVKCNINIPIGRIQALPDTKYCVKCVSEPATPDPNVLCAKSSSSARNGWGKND